MTNETPSAPEPTARRRLRSGRILLVLLVAALVALALLNACFSAPRYRGPVSDHFDGRVFLNDDADELPDHGFLDFLRWRFEREPGAWDGFVAPSAPSVPPERVDGDELRITFVGHATVLIQTAGLNVLTDPIWSERASPVSWAGPARHAPPGVDFDALPPIDVVLVSHNHYDHLDVETLRRLADAHAPVVLAPLGNAALFAEEGIDGGRDLDWWDEVDAGSDVRITCVPAQHFSGRGFSDRNATLWAGWVLETPAGVVYFAGDTGHGPHFDAVRRRFGPVRLALLPIGAYLPRWFMEPVHLDPREAVEAHVALDARTSLGIHFGCFELADDGPEQPEPELESALEELGVDAARFWTLVAGETRLVPPLATEHRRAPETPATARD